MKKTKIITMIMALTMTTAMFASTANAATVTTTATTATTVAPESTYSIEYEGHVQDVGWQTPVTVVGDQNDITTLPLAGTSGLGLRVEAIKVTGVNLPAGAAIEYVAHVQNKGWLNPVVENGNTAIGSAPEGGTDGLGLRVEAFKMTLFDMPGYAIKYRAHVQSIGWQAAVETENGMGINESAEAGTNGKGLRMEALQIQIVKTDVEKAAEIKAINAVNLAESSKLATDIALAKTAIASVADTVEQATLTANLTSGNLITVTNTTPVIIPQVQPVVGIEPAPVVPVSPIIDTTLSPIVDVDSPTDGQTITSSTMNIKGWALESSGVSGVTTNIDNSYSDGISCTISRPDVQALYPKYNQLVSGYSITEDITNLSNGIHTVTVTVTGKDGKTSTVTRKINVQLPNASHENTALETLINPNSDFDATSGWDVSDLNKTLDSISTQYLNNQISAAEAQKEMYTYSINLPGHTDTRVSKVYFTTNTTSGTDGNTVASFVNSGGNYNKCKIWMNANGTNTITTIGADETSN